MKKLFFIATLIGLYSCSGKPWNEHDAHAQIIIIPAPQILSFTRTATNSITNTAQTYLQTAQKQFLNPHTINQCLTKVKSIKTIAASGIIERLSIGCNRYQSILINLYCDEKDKQFAIAFLDTLVNTVNHNHQLEANKAIETRIGKLKHTRDSCVFAMKQISEKLKMALAPEAEKIRLEAQPLIDKSIKASQAYNKALSDQNSATAPYFKLSNARWIAVRN